ncbi:hypothetical protein GDO86_004281 [Hymenochirus boettgeri]|uniref:Uncharacterized protein n=1 Tax=Hymenochirus boettgeri TaxID=247094 RepID=A0A8T2KD59_9PIPI|nr:hypothetical protein GDO86_004281 [Hymenochirus boettgeri]
MPDWKPRVLKLYNFQHGTGGEAFFLLLILRILQQYWTKVETNSVGMSKEQSSIFNKPLSGFCAFCLDLPDMKTLFLFMKFL